MSTIDNMHQLLDQLDDLDALDEREAADIVAAPTWRAVVRTMYLLHGPLTPEFVVEFARPADSPLHDCLGWDSDTEALDNAISMLSSWSDLQTGPVRS